MGAKWRVGDGQKIWVYDEQWLLGDSDSKVMSPISFLPSDAIVADLIDPRTGWWNSQIIDQNFLPFEARKIKPISTVAQEDILIWQKSKDGSYVVKPG